jgi:hypothetical protein
VNVAKVHRHGYNDKPILLKKKVKRRDNKSLACFFSFSYKAGLMNFHTSQRINGKPNKQ